MTPGSMQNILPLGISAIQSLSAMQKKKKADAAMPGLVDPRQAAFLAELNQKRKAIDTGADFASAMTNIDSTNAATQDAITRSSGGNVGSTIEGLLSAQRGADTAKGSVIAQGQGQQMALNSMFNELNNKVAARSMQLQMQRSQQARAEWAQKQQNANQNFMAAAAGLGSSMQGPQNSGGIPDMAQTVTPENMTSINPGLLPTGEKNLDPSFLMNMGG